MLPLSFWLGVFLSLASTVQGQQRMQYTQYLNNSFLVNPALTGVESYFEGRLSYSHQWAGFKGAPRALLLSGHQGLFRRILGDDFETSSLAAPGRRKYAPTRKGVVGVMNKPARDMIHFGIGGSIYSEQTGPISYNGAAGSFAAHLPLTKKWRFSTGATLELLNYRLDPSKVTLADANDVAVAESRVSLVLPGLNAGFALYRDNFFLSGSARQLLKNRIQLTNSNPVISGLVTHYYLQAGYRVHLDESWALLPTVAYRNVEPAQASVDINLRADYKNQFYFGLGYRHEDALVGQLGFTYSDFLRLHYSYDFTISNLRSQSSGTHGVTLVMVFPGAWHGSDFNPYERKYFW